MARVGFKTAYMCGVHWQHHVGADAKGVPIFASVEGLKAELKCWESCGIVKVRLHEHSWPVEQDLQRGVKK